MDTSSAPSRSRTRALLAISGALLIPLSGWSASLAPRSSVHAAALAPISIEVASPRPGQVGLSWTTTVRADSFKIKRDGHVVAGTPGKTKRYLDKGLESNTTYSYQLIGLSQGTITSVSKTVSIDPDGPTGSDGSGGAVGTQQNWPCTGCILSVPTTYNPHIPTALLVALHGDEGVSSIIAGAWMPVTEKANVILFAPQCPTDHGCYACVDGDCSNSWWYWFQYSPSYDDAWIGQQVSIIEAKYDIDRAREYITGWSGGADYMGWYALTHASRFAAANFVVGGVPYTSTCPSRKLAAYFLMGSEDFRYLSGQPSQVQQILDGCGDQTEMVVLPGEDHTGTIEALTTEGYASKILTWLMSHILTGELPS